MDNNFCKIRSVNSKLLKKKIKSNNFTKAANCQDVIQVSILLEAKETSTKQKTISFSAPRFSPMHKIKQMITARIPKSMKNCDIVGYESIKTDYGPDYRLHKVIGQAQKNMNLRCLFRNDAATGIQKYKIYTCLAVGGFSKVFLARSKINGQFYAAKFMKKQQSSAYDRKLLLQNQRNISCSVNFPFLVKTVQFIETKNFNIFIMEYCPGGELFYKLKQIKSLNQQDSRFCLIEILLGLEELHNMDIMYRDLKPQNILINHDGHLKIADFGLAKSCKIKSYSFCGSLQYMPPEIIKGIGHSKFVDFYCIGALLYEMLVGCPPFYSAYSDENNTKIRILTQFPKFPKQLKISDQAKDIIFQLLIKNEKERLGYFGGVKQIMMHPWIGKIDKQKYIKKEMKSPFLVDLNILNFDPNEVGHSERLFQRKILRDIKSQSHQKARINSKNREIRKFSESSLKKQVSPYHSKIKLFKNSQKTIKGQEKSPYLKILSPKNNISNLRKSYKILKTQTIQSRNTFINSRNNKFIQAIRLTQQTQNKENNKLFNIVNKQRVR